MPYKDPEKRRAFDRSRNKRRQAYSRTMYWKHREKKLEAHRKYYASHSAQWKKRYKKNKPKILARMKDWHQANRDKHNLRKRLLRKDNPEKFRKAELLGHLRNRKKRIARMKDYYRRNYEKNYGKFLLSSIKRRKMLKDSAIGCPKKLSAFYRRVRAAKSIRCHWCRKLVPKNLRHVDHIIPLSKGGLHAAGNLASSCRSCNCAKRARMPDDFVKWLKEQKATRN